MPYDLGPVPLKTVSDETSSTPEASAFGAYGSGTYGVFLRLVILGTLVPVLMLPVTPFWGLGVLSTCLLSIAR